MELGQCGSVAGDCLGIVAESCPGLRDWWVTDMDDASIQRSRAHNSVTAIKSLTRLTQLTRIEFAPSGYFEVMAFVTAAQHLVRAGSLRVVRVQAVRQHADNSWEYLPVAALMHLCRLSGLRELAVCLGRAAVTFQEVYDYGYDAATFIGGLCGIGRVLITACEGELAVLKFAQAMLAAHQIEVPNVELRQCQQEEVEL